MFTKSSFRKFTEIAFHAMQILKSVYETCPFKYQQNTVVDVAVVIVIIGGMSLWFGLSSFYCVSVNLLIWNNKISYYSP